MGACRWQWRMRMAPSGVREPRGMSAAARGVTGTGSRWLGRLRDTTRHMRTPQKQFAALPLEWRSCPSAFERVGVGPLKRTCTSTLTPPRYRVEEYSTDRYACVRCVVVRTGFEAPGVRIRSQRRSLASLIIPPSSRHAPRARPRRSAPPAACSGVPGPGGVLLDPRRRGAVMTEAATVRNAGEVARAARAAAPPRRTPDSDT